MKIWGRKDAGAPRWMTTFADLMAVLVVFFVMLYSMSTIDNLRYQQMADSLREVLGPSAVGDDTPRPAPSVVDLDGDFASIERPQINDIDQPEYTQLDEIRDALREALADDIEDGVIQLGEDDEGVLLRFEDHAAFELGRKELQDDFLPVLERIAGVLAETPGIIRVAGHTDDLPIQTDRFRSNFELSSARAVSVVHVFQESGLPSRRMVAQGHADTRPLVPNTSDENRAKNRRVEVVLTEAPEDTSE
ncbi:flagellar motor protein MotB [Halorhodospira halochloris]|uniref:flagellar motor protein MotB n=1 Tax=Halorhodospira halochloris TaxID=1052 RepID=UPI002379BFCD|nr:flagellar motor protein MotB [Halorhodospira halochloris]